ncbi:MAG: MobC family plasmid mobilization relaxosome protein [Candidatus Pacearchaeota archaeon]|nr:MobC family plasmid mobilization relaxosome protein [Candidatus Pacearchaeota archaeon]
MEKEKRTKSIKIRLTPAEHKALLERAKKPRLAEWLRELGLGEKPKKSAPKIDPKLIRELGLIGNNLNQISRRLNSYQPVAKIEILMILKEIRSEIERLSK